MLSFLGQEPFLAVYSPVQCCALCTQLLHGLAERKSKNGLLSTCWLAVRVYDKRFCFTWQLTMSILTQCRAYRVAQQLAPMVSGVVQQQGGHIEHLMQKLQDVTVTLDNS